MHVLERKEYSAERNGSYLFYCNHLKEREKEIIQDRQKERKTFN